MLEVTATMWPLGRQDRAYEMASLWLACQGQDQATGERSYKVALGKDKAFKGRPRDPQGPVWRRGFIAGHRAGPRGVWDLVGGALGVLLGSRLHGYRGAVDPGGETVEIATLEARASALGWDGEGDPLAWALDRLEGAP